jgi:hypothetical protein
MKENCVGQKILWLQPWLMALSVLMTVITASSIANACECYEYQTPPCAFYSRADAVFIGTIASTSSNNTQGYDAKNAQFRIDEVFKGLSGATTEVEFPFPDCNVRPNVGEKYLVYARREFSGSGPGQLVSRNCDGTRLLKDASSDLGYLRKLSDKDLHGSISARILGIREHELDGVEISVQGFDRVVTSGVDAEGFYKFDLQKPGTYQIQVSVPLQLDVLAQLGLSATKEPSKTIISYAAVLKGNECDYKEIKVIRRYSAGISGNVVDENGRPVPRLSIQLYPVSAKPDFRFLGGRTEGTDVAGNYSFKSVKEGRYFLGVNLGAPPDFSAPYPKTFFPGVSSAEEATIISLEENQQLSLETLRLRPRLVERIVSGFLVWSDGSPVIKRQPDSSTPGSPHLYLLDPERLIGINGARPDGSFTIRIEEDGRFSFVGYDGYTYVIHVNALNSRGEWMHAKHVKVTIGRESPVLRLTVSLPGKGQSEDVMKKELEDRQ